MRRIGGEFVPALFLVFGVPVLKFLIQLGAVSRVKRRSLSRNSYLK